VLLQEMYFGIQFDLLFFGESVPPSLELLGEFDLPRHTMNITPKEYNVNGISRFPCIRLTRRLLVAETTAISSPLTWKFSRSQPGSQPSKRGLAGGTHC
jgi:hypothetical protein